MCVRKEELEKQKHDTFAYPKLAIFFFFAELLPFPHHSSLNQIWPDRTRFFLSPPCQSVPLTSPGALQFSVFFLSLTTASFKSTPGIIRIAHT